MRQDAVIRNLEVMGEAVREISDTTRAAHPEVPWRQIAATRDRVIHVMEQWARRKGLTISPTA